MVEEPKTVRSEGMGREPLPIEYATPSAKEVARDEIDKLLYIARRSIFALGIGLLIYGVGMACTTGSTDASALMGWGAALAALVMPWGWRRRRRTEN